MTVKIELIRKTGNNPFYQVISEPYVDGCIKVFTFQDDAPADSIWNKHLAFFKAKEYAIILKNGITETRELIETL